MNRTVLYVILALIAVGILTYAMGESGLLGGILGLLGIGGSKGLAHIKQKAIEGDKEAKEVQARLRKIEEEKRQLEKDGVKDMTPEEEREYWKNQ